MSGFLGIACDNKLVRLFRPNITIMSTESELEAYGELRFQAGLKRAAEIAAAEEELVGPMPAELKFCSPEEIARSAVRCTKRNIEQAILKEIEGE